MTLNWTHEANLWLKEIHSYIAKDNRTAATSTVLGIQQRARQLKRFPRLGYRLDFIGERELRVLLYGHYRIVYLLKSETDIDVLGVFHGALDLEQYIF